MAAGLTVLLVAALAVTVHADVTVTVAASVYNFGSCEADFGPGLSAHGTMGVLQVAEPVDGCSTLSPPQMNDSSFIALIIRGNCKFGEKVLAAQAAGFVGAIVYDDIDEDLIVMATDVGGVTIPSVFVSRSSGSALVDLKGQVARLTPDVVMRWPSYVVSFAVIVSSALVILIFVVFYRRCYMHRRAVATVIVSSAQISKLPTRVAGPVNADPANREMCCICLEEHAEGDVLTILPCQHAFHKRCIEPWLLQSHRTCPICKRDPCPSECTPLINSADTA